MRVLETDIEEWVVKEAEALGIPSLKLNLKGNRGWPDRIFLIAGGRPLFIEFKRPGEEPRKLQQQRHRILRKLGYEIQVHEDRQEALSALKAAQGR